MERSPLTDQLTRGLEGLTKQTSRVHKGFLGIVGPMGRVLAASAGLAAGFFKLKSSIRDTGDEMAKFGRDARTELEKLETQYESLLKSEALAKDRVTRNAEFAAKTPFAQEATFASDLTLQAQTGGALNSEEELRRIGDAAASSINPTSEGFKQVSLWVGRLYEQLQNNLPVGEATRRLNELGVMSGETRRQLESLTESGASFGQKWAAVTSELDKAAGGMEKLSQTMAGLKTTQADSVELLKASVGKSFEDGEKAGLQAQIKLVNALRQSAVDLTKPFAQARNEGKKFLATLIDGATNIPGFSAMVTTLGVAITSLAGAVVYTGAMFVASLVTGLVAFALNVRTSAGATQNLKAALMEMGAAAKFAATGQWESAAAASTSAKAHLMAAHSASKASASYLASGAAASRSTAAIGAFGRVLTVLGKGVAFVVRMFASFLLIPALILGAVHAIMILKNRYEEARDAVKNLKDGTDALTQSLDRQINAIRTENDLLAAQAQASKIATQAQVDLAKAKFEADRTNSTFGGRIRGVFGAQGEELRERQRRATEAEQRREQVYGISRSNLELSDEAKARRQKFYDASRDIYEHQQERIAGEARPGRERVSAFEGLLAQREAEAQYAARERAGQSSNTLRQDAANATVSEKRQQLAVLEAGLEDANLRKERASSSRNPEAFGIALDDIADLTVAIKGLNQEIFALENVEVGLTGASDIDKLNAKIKLYDLYHKAVTDAGDALTKIKDLEGQEPKERAKTFEVDLQDARRDFDIASQRERASANLAGRFGIDLESPAQQGRRRFDRDNIKANIERFEDPKRVEEIRLQAQKEAKDAAIAVDQERVAALQSINEAENRGLSTTLRSIDLERERLALLYEAKRISDENAQGELQALAAREVAARNSASRDREDEVNSIRAGVLRGQARSARLSGRGQEARDLEEKAKQQEEAAAERARIRALQEKGVGTDAAKDIAGNERTIAQSGRQLERLLGSQATITASSLAQIGGGGGVSGADPLVKGQERANALLEEIKQATATLSEVASGLENAVQ